ncbi:hypothetical protein BDV30DRAFT_211692 [Aspergillus minisclerotigenes]|uniref:Uncharacterized protein n=1 Tax=Aspergillus minisclerotigenes TaxID=656917 RepID=A0A5N6J149_9EURO|nr:hypothetical protein BDV30DRAFT_211692 [Aspergillus minisclerotigenes]
MARAVAARISSCIAASMLFIGAEHMWRLNSILAKLYSSHLHRQLDYNVEQNTYNPFPIFYSPYNEYNRSSIYPRSRLECRPGFHPLPFFLEELQH